MTSALTNRVQGARLRTPLVDPRRAVLQPARDRARQHDPQRRDPDDRPRPRRHEQPAAVDGRRVHAGVRGPAAHRRAASATASAGAARCSSAWWCSASARCASAFADSAEPAHRDARVHGHRRRVHHAGDAVDHHQRVPAGRAGQGDRRVGRRRPGSPACSARLTGGFLLEHFYWGSIFLVNIPIVIVGVLAGLLPHPHVEGPVGAAARPGRRGALDRRARRRCSTGSSRRRRTAGRDRTILACVRRRRRVARRVLRCGRSRIDHPMLDVQVLQEPALHRREHRRS